MQQRDTYLQGEQRQLFLSKKNQYLAIGKVPEDIFWLLVEMSAIRSQGIIKALYDYLVLGDSRKVICERYNVNNGYISTSLSRLERMNEMIKEIIPRHVKWYAGTNNYCECCARAI
ncbi:PapB/FocB family fimbrial expression transcriptional regulator [Escherichia coli]